MQTQMNVTKPTATLALLTDFGNKDGFVGVMKGVLYGLLSSSINMVDLSHEIAPQSVWEGAWVLGNAMDYFPRQSVFLCVVDPHVGNPDQAHLLLHDKDHDRFFIGPDNGLLTPALQLLLQGFHIRNVRYFRTPDTSQTFHGRDIYAPVTAHLINALHAGQLNGFLEQVGEPVSIENLNRLAWQPPVQDSKRLCGQILHIDCFGNLITNIPSQWLSPNQPVTLQLSNGPTWNSRLVSSYDAGSGREAPFLLSSSNGMIEISLYARSAQELLQVTLGHSVEIFR